MAAPQLAKLTPPRLGKVYQRTRLFKQLDAARKDHPVIWISAPAGSGKTTLVTSYLEQQKIKPLWYAVDEGDADPASFFYYLGLLGKQAAPRKTPALPLLTPEYLLGLPTFTRNFFRELFSRIKAPGVLVLDNYQDAGIDCPLHELLSRAISEVPEDLQLIIVSRHEPPSVFSREITSNSIKIINFQDIALTDEEAISVAQIQSGDKVVDEKHIKQLREQTQGWVSGLILYLRQQSTASDKSVDPRLDPQQLFNYFANEIFQQTDAVTHQFLLRTAFLETISLEAATRLSDNTNAKKILERLAAFNYFTVRRASQHETYEYHPLFREFLQIRAQEELPLPELIFLQQETAQQLITEGNIEAAAAIYITTRDIEQLSRIIATNAQSILESGKWQTLLRWYEAIPENVLSTQPWLLFWLASAYMATDLFKARSLYKEALDLFIAQNDPVGSYLAWSGGVDSFNYLWIDFKPLDEWLVIFDVLRSKFPDFITPFVELRVTYAIFSACLWRKPETQLMRDWALRAEELLNTAEEPTTRLMMGCYVLLYHLWWQGNLNRTDVIFNKVKIIADTQEVSILSQLFWHVMGSAHAYLHNQHELGVDYAHAGLELANETGVFLLSSLLHAQAIYGYLTGFDQEGAKTELSQMETLLQNTETFDFAHYHYLAAWISLNDNQAHTALEHANTALASAIKIDASIYPPYAQLTVARSLYESNNRDEGLKLSQNVYEWGEMLGDTYVLVNHLMLVAYDALLCQDIPQFRINISKAFEISKVNNHIMVPWNGWHLPLLIRLYTESLNQGIEVDYVRHIIIERKIPLPSNTTIPENWPYPVKLYTLGRFSLLLDDEKQDLSGKSAARPLALLKCLIALGGRDVAQEKLIEALWPDMDGDAGSKAFHTTLYRLRKLIQHDEAIMLKDGLLTLDPRYVWVDAWALERSLSQLEQACEQNQPTDDVETLANQVTNHYKGAFLQQDKDSVWALAYRERLQIRVQRALIALGQYWQNQSLMDKAIAVFEQLLDLDRLHEPAYQQLMQLFISQGRHAEAAAIYERCRKVLSTALGVMPSAQTLTLYQSIEME